MMDVIGALNPRFSQEELQSIEEGLRASLSQCNSDTIPGVMPNVLAGRIAGRFGFKGRSLILDSACASSLVAVEIAIGDLISRKCDLALAGGVHVNAFAYFYQMFCGLGALSRQQQIRPFDDSADGTILGEGVGMVVLKRLSDAIADQDRIYAVITGIGTSSDGQGTSMLAPSSDGEALALARAYEMAAVSPKSIALLEAHGTGTPSGDVVEMQAIHKVFGAADSAWCALGSVKSMIGHTQAASGVAGLIKTALSLYHRLLPPTLNVSTPNTQIDWSSSPCYINTQARTWIHPKVHPQVPESGREQLSVSDPAPRRAAVSAFGFGGVNAHAVLEEFDDEFESERPSLIQSWPTELCLFTGDSRDGLVERLLKVRQYCQDDPSCSLRDVAYTLAKANSDSKAGTLRLAVVAYSVFDLKGKIDAIVSCLEQDENPQGQDVYFVADCQRVSGKLAFVLPGLGAAYPNMLADLCFNFPDVRAVFDYVDQLAVSFGADVLPSKKVFPHPFAEGTENAATLAAMDSAVVTVLLAEWALFTIFQKLGVKPDVLLGCSTGEFAALTMGGAVDILAAAPMFFRLSTTVSRSVPKEKLAELRSAMVLGDYDQIEEALSPIDSLYLGAALSPSQTIISGSQKAIAAATAVLSELDIPSTVLPTAIPYHTPLVSGFVDHDNEELKQLPLTAPTTPAWSCSSAGPYPCDVAQMRQMTTQLFTRPILLKKTIEAMYADGVTQFVEVGPKGVLTSLIADILSDRPHVAVASNYSHGSSLTQLLHCLGELFARSVPMQLDYLFARRSPVLLQFDGGSTSKRRAMKLNLQYPAVTVPPPVLERLRASGALNDKGSGERIETGSLSAGSDDNVEGAAVWHTASEAPATHDPAFEVMQHYLSQLGEFHRNLMDVQQSIMSAYLGQDNPEEMPGENSWYPLVQTGLMHWRLEDREAEAVVMLTLDSHRYLRDHAIGGVVSGADGDAERVYLMPLTVALELMSEVASALLPGSIVTKLSEIKAFKRIRVGSAGLKVSVRAIKQDNNAVAQIEVIDGGSSASTTSPSMQCRVHFGSTYPSPPAWSLPPDSSRAPRTDEGSLYGADSMFHGPLMQSVRQLESTGRQITRAVVEARPAVDWFPTTSSPQFVLDPLLLDNATQPVLFHLFENNEEVTALLPFLVESLDLFANLGSLRGGLRVHACLNSITSKGTEADVYLTDGNGNLLARFLSITSRRIALTQKWKELIAAPARSYLTSPIQSVLVAGGDGRLASAMLRLDQLPEDDSTLNWCLDYILSLDEREIYDGLPNIQRKRQWLAGRIAAKDAVRRLMLPFDLDLCPADVIIDNDGQGRPFVRSSWLPKLGWAPIISISHKQGMAAAIAAPSLDFAGVGIDVEEIVCRDEGFERLALSPEEIREIEPVESALRNSRMTQYWCAKEAAGKALGTGLSANPKSLKASLKESQGNSARLLVTNGHDTPAMVAHCSVEDGMVFAFTALEAG
jgi:acyl transferase domain-containing protein/phosphopantetheinyl transferase